MPNFAMKLLLIDVQNDNMNMLISSFQRIV